MLPAGSVALDAISPTMYVRLACPARVAFRQAGTRRAGKPSDAIIIGRIAHRAIELAIRGESVDGAWSTAITESVNRGERPQALPRLRRAQLRYQKRAAEALTFTEGVDESHIHCEEMLRSVDGTLVGTPDLVVVRSDGCDVVDFKSGLVVDLDEHRPTADYASQIRIYAHLAAEAYGVSASRGVLLSFRQGRVDVDVSPRLLNDAVHEAHERRRAFNDLVPGPQPTRAGDTTCRWCEQKLICDGFWDALADASSGITESALRGTICSPPERSQNGLLAVQIEVSAGANSGTVATIAEIPINEAANWAVGDEVGFTAIRLRSDDNTVYIFAQSSRSYRWTT